MLVDPGYMRGAANNRGFHHGPYQVAPPGPPPPQFFAGPPGPNPALFYPGPGPFHCMFFIVDSFHTLVMRPNSLASFKRWLETVVSVENLIGHIKNNGCVWSFCKYMNSHEAEM